ncbi:MAG TPA: hypothetical protein VN213_05145 [Solirubrobacteraceae bacterium]|nr:hypothetical protein [Solirubrobacteraceae bacterium]
MLAAEPVDEPSRAAELVLAAMARLAAAERLEESHALRAQSGQAIRKAKGLADRLDGLDERANGGTSHRG